MAPKIIPPKPSTATPLAAPHYHPDAPNPRPGIRPGDGHGHVRPGNVDSTRIVLPDGGDPGQTGADTSIKVSDMPAAAISPVPGERLPLESYHIRSTSSLPATNDQGLRTYQGRDYADLAQGGTVQVRQDPVTGVYRATLASERLPSGPELLLDGPTMTWSPATSLSSELPDAALMERLYKGRDDVIEHQIKSQGYAMAGRGVTSFSPIKQRVIIDALATVQQTVGLAAAVANRMPGWSKQVVAKTIGEGEVYFARVVESWKAIAALGAQYLQPSGLARFVCVDNPFNSQVHGFIRPDDTYGRIFLIGDKVNRGAVFDMALAHEISHLGQVHEMSGAGPGTVDYLYLPHDPRGRTQSAFALARGELEDARFDAWPASTSMQFVNKINEMTSSAHSRQQAVEVFNQDPRVRAEILSTTADIVAFSAFQLSSVFKAERARLQAKRKAPDE